MTVIGQPKTTSEYIQATSRVGRSKKGPASYLQSIIVPKPRDRSHFEHFQEYHSKIYSKVEPTSVYPIFCPARERALHSVLVGMIRFYSEKAGNHKAYPSAEVIESNQLIYDRVNLIDEEEYEKQLN